MFSISVNLVFIFLLSISVVCTDSTNHVVRRLDSEVDYNDELGKFYYPITYIKLPEEQEQTLTPANTKPGETYTVTSSISLSAEELSIDKSTGVINIKHMQTSTKGEVAITVTSSSEYKFAFVVDFLESKYMIGATTQFQTPYWAKGCPVPHKDDTPQNGIKISTPINMFKMDQTLDDLLKVVGITDDSTRFMYINITGFIKVDNNASYTFYIQSIYNAQIEVDGKVIVTNFNTCPDKDQEKGGTVELTKGYHEVLLHAVGGITQMVEFDGVEKEVGGWGFDFKYQIDNGEKDHITLYYLPEYTYAHSLVFFKSSYAWGLDVLQSIEFTVNDAAECKTEPPLPEGIEITTKMITGTSKETFTKSFLVSCFSTHSTTNQFNVTIDVTDVFLPGLVGYYMKYDMYISPPRSSMPKRNDASSHLKVLRIESNVNKEYNELPTVWKGLGADFITQFGVHWEGVIRFPKAGAYSMKLTCDDSCYLKITKRYELTVYGGGNVTRTATHRVSEGDSLTQYILLEYSQFKGASLFEFLIKGPDDEDFRYPGDLLFYNPPGKLQYTYIVAVYSMNVDLPSSNKPIFSGIDITVNKPTFTINKELPRGISLNSESGDIEGKPLVSSKRDEYVITAEFENHESLSVEIFITVEDVKPPNDVYFYNPVTNEKYTENTPGKVHLGSYVSLQASDDSESVIAQYFYEGNLPTTSFDEDKAILSGVITELGEFTVSLMGSNGAGSDTSNIKIIVEQPCKTGEQNILFSLSPNVLKYEFSVVDGTGKTVIAPIDISQSSTWYYEVCMPENNDYKVKVWNNIPHDLTYYVNVYSNGKHIINGSNRGSTIDGGVDEYSFKTTSVPSTISYRTSDFVWEQYTSATESPVYYNTLVNFRITPSQLPKGVSFGSDGYFIGVTRDTYPKMEYNITAETLDGDIVRLPVTIEVLKTSCSRHGNSLIRVNAYVEKSLYLVYMYMTIKDQSNTIVMEITGKELEKDLDFYACVTPGDYKLHCESPSVNGYGWGDSYMDVFLDDAPMGHCSIESESEGPITYDTTLHLSYNIDINTEWEYSSKLEQGWNTNSFAGRWNKAKIESIPTEGNSLYLRKLIPIHDVDTFSAFYSRFDIMSGLIYYINGKEMGRVNVPAGVLSDSQKATKSFSSLTPVSYVLPIAMFEKQEALVSIELHRYSDTEQFNAIALYTVDLNGDDQESCTRLHSFGKVSYIDPPEASAMTRADFAMDSQVGTYYQGRIASMIGEQPSMKISFGENRYVFINRFMFVGGMKSQYQQGPKHIEFYEKIPSGYFNIGKMDIPEPKDSNEIVNTDIYENDYLTNELQVNFTAYEGQSLFKIYDIMPGVCHIFYCMKTDLLPYTEGGKNVTIGCADGAAGERTFLCPTGKNPQWREIANNCPVAPVILSKVDSYDFEIGKSETVTLFTYSGFIKSMSISPGLPSCIKQQPFLYGVYKAEKCYDELIPTNFSFKISNDYGDQTVVSKLSIKPTDKPVIVDPVSSYVFYIGSNVEVNLFKVLGASLTISVEPALPKGLSLDLYTGKISGSPVEELEETNFLFSVSNNVDKVVISIKLSVAITNKPVIIEAPAEKTTFIYGFTYSELRLYRVVGKELKYFINSGKLPQELKIDQSTGRVYGKVTSKESGSFVVGVSSTSGETVEMTINYEIIESDKPFVVETKEEQVFEFGTEIKDMKLFDVAGDNITFSVIPALPEGLVLDEKTGLISGSVKANTGNKMYTFYFKNEKGLESCKILLSFNIPIVPVILKYEKEMTFMKNINIESTTILTVTGNGDMKFRVTPDLPVGMKLNEITGSVSGKPIENSKKTYVFTVYNSYGSNNASVVIEIITIYCEAEGEWGKTEALTNNYVGCKTAYSGNRYRSCLVTDKGTAVWGGIIDDCSIETGLIVGLVIVGIVAVALIVLVVIFCIYRRNAIKKINSDKKKRQITSDKGIHM